MSLFGVGADGVVDAAEFVDDALSSTTSSRVDL
jgi:hypothetical protein